MSAPAESSPICPVKECVKEPPGPLLCASSYEYLSPLLLAEELCPQAVAAAIKAERERPEEGKNFEAGQQFRLGSLFLDLSNAWGVRDVSSKKFAAQGFELLHAAAKSEQPSRAKTLSTFLCAYESAWPHRWENPSEVVLDAVNAELVRITKSVQELPPTHVAQDEFFRCGIMMLYSTYDCLAYPSTARESLDLRGMVDTQAHQPVGHPLYTIEYGGKMPHRNKGKRAPQVDTERIVAIRFDRMAKVAFENADPSTTVEESEAGRLALDWLCDKASGVILSEEQEDILLHMGGHLNQKRREWYRDWKEQPIKGRASSNEV